jgi:hypothetical protein
MAGLRYYIRGGQQFIIIATSLLFAAMELYNALHDRSRVFVRGIVALSDMWAFVAMLALGYPDGSTNLFMRNNMATQLIQGRQVDWLPGSPHDYAMKAKKACGLGPLVDIVKRSRSDYYVLTLEGLRVAQYLFRNSPNIHPLTGRSLAYYVGTHADNVNVIDLTAVDADEEEAKPVVLDVTMDSDDDDVFW